MAVPPDVEVDIRYVAGYGCHHARNKIACMAIDEGFDEVLYVDADQIVPKDTLQKLLAVQSPIRAGWSMMAVADQRTNVSVYDPQKRHYDFILKNDLPKDKLIKVDALGFAAILIKTEVFGKMTYPYFKYVEYGNRTTLSEDLYFCDVARKKNIDVICDTSLCVQHVKTIVI